jgi:hypothetical protein
MHSALTGGVQPASPPHPVPDVRAVAPLPEMDPRLPPLHVALPDGGQARLPGTLWPEPAERPEHAVRGTRPRSRRAGAPPPVCVRQVARRDVNPLYERWRHPLGAYRRPFAEQHYLLEVDGQPAAAVSSGSVQSRTVAGGLPRFAVVELARIARSPEHPHALRALLRLWREYLAPRWADRYWPVEAAIAYALPGRDGRMYRFDGWTRHGPCRPWGGGGTWSRASATDRLADGIKTLWIYRYSRAPTRAS